MDHDQPLFLCSIQIPGGGRFRIDDSQSVNFIYLWPS
jgi:hypothetical protein